MQIIISDTHELNHFSITPVSIIIDKTLIRDLTESDLVKLIGATTTDIVNSILNNYYNGEHRELTK